MYNIPNIIETNVNTKILEGMMETSSLVSKTFGPNGKNVIIDGYNRYLSCDGYTVCMNINFDDRLKDFGSYLLKETARFQKDICGDGTTSVILLATELCKNFNTYTNININQIKMFKNEALEKLEILSNKSFSESEFVSLIHTSSGDEQITKVVYETLLENYKNNNYYEIINYKPTFKENIYYEKYNGMFLEYGLVNTLLKEKSKIVLNKPVCILYNDNLDNIDDFNNILKISSNKEIFIFVNMISKDIIDYISYINKKNGYNIGVVINREHGVKSSTLLEDLRTYLNVDVINKNIIKDNLKINSKATYIEITDEYTIIKRDEESDEKLDKLIETLKTNANDKKVLERLTRLTNSIKTIYIPLTSEYRYEIIKEKLTNAVNSGLRGIKNGISIGMGETYNKLINLIEDKNDEYKLIKKSLKVINEYLKKDISSSFIPFDATDNLKMILINSLNLLETFLSINGYVKVTLNEPKNFDIN